MVSGVKRRKKEPRGVVRWAEEGLDHHPFHRCPSCLSSSSFFFLFHRLSLLPFIIFQCSSLSFPLLLSSYPAPCGSMDFSPHTHSPTFVTGNIGRVVRARRGWETAWWVGIFSSTSSPRSSGSGGGGGSGGLGGRRHQSRRDSYGRYAYTSDLSCHMQPSSALSLSFSFFRLLPSRSRSIRKELLVDDY